MELPGYKAYFSISIVVSSVTRILLRSYTVIMTFYCGIHIYAAGDTAATSFIPANESETFDTTIYDNITEKTKVNREMAKFTLQVSYILLNYYT